MASTSTLSKAKTGIIDARITNIEPNRIVMVAPVVFVSMVPR